MLTKKAIIALAVRVGAVRQLASGPRKHPSGESTSLPASIPLARPRLRRKGGSTLKIFSGSRGR